MHASIKAALSGILLDTLSDSVNSVDDEFKDDIDNIPIIMVKDTKKTSSRKKKKEL